MSRRQPHRLPPPLISAGESLNGPIFSEWESDTALLLWKTVRSVRLWAEIPADERASAFAPSAFDHRVRQIEASYRGGDHDGTPPLGPLLTAAGVLKGEAEDASEIGRACQMLAEWARGTNRLGTALELMQAAALVLPMDADLARAVGRIARDRAEYAQSESWFRHAISVARRTRNWPAQVWSYIGLGYVHYQRGNLPTAHKAFLRALRAATRHSLHELRAFALHDLTVTAIRADRSRSASTYADAALDAYPPDHPRLPALAHDMAVFWMERGYFEQARKVFQAMPADFGEPADQLARAASLVRAAAAAGRREEYEAAWRDATALLDHPAAQQHAAMARLSMARGAASAGDWERAQRAAEDGLTVARDRGEMKLVFEAESILESVQRGRGAEHLAPEETKRPSQPVGMLAERLATTVAAATVAA